MKMTPPAALLDAAMKIDGTGDQAAGLDLSVLEPPVAPLAMPKQVLTREAGSGWRGLGLFAVFRRDLGRAG